MLSEVLTDVDAQVFVAAHHLHFKLPNEQWPVRAPLLHVHYHLLHLVRVEVIVHENNRGPLENGGFETGML